jgi:uncharacterized protein
VAPKRLGLDDYDVANQRLVSHQNHGLDGHLDARLHPVPIRSGRPSSLPAAGRWSVCDALRIDQRISLVTLGVSDLSTARSFYEALGWRVAQQPDDEVCFFQAGGMVFGLWTALGGHGAPGIELAHNVRSPEEVSAVLTEAEHAGGTLVRPAARADWGGTTGAFADPDGYVWEVAYNPGWTLDDDGAVHV